MIKRLIVLFFALGVWGLVGCSQREESLTHTEWTHSTTSADGSHEVVLTFHLLSLCSVRHTHTDAGGTTTTQQQLDYLYTTPKVLLMLPDGGQAVGVIYDAYTRLELRWGDSEITFFRTR